MLLYCTVLSHVVHYFVTCCVFIVFGAKCYVVMLYDNVDYYVTTQDAADNMSLVTRLQMRIKQLEWEKTLMQRDIDRKTDGAESAARLPDNPEKEIYDTIRVTTIFLLVACGKHVYVLWQTGIRL